MTVFYTAVSPLVMLAFVGFSLKTPSTSTSIPPAWCGIVATRILRKVITPHVITHITYYLQYQCYHYYLHVHYHCNYAFEN